MTTSKRGCEDWAAKALIDAEISSLRNGGDVNGVQPQAQQQRGAFHGRVIRKPSHWSRV